MLWKTTQTKVVLWAELLASFPPALRTPDTQAKSGSPEWSMDQASETLQC